MDLYLLINTGKPEQERKMIKQQFIPPYQEQQWDARVKLAIEERIRLCRSNQPNTIRAIPVLPQFPQPTMAAKRVNP